jgi:hypothetical protein
MRCQSIGTIAQPLNGSSQSAGADLTFIKNLRRASWLIAALIGLLSISAARADVTVGVSDFNLTAASGAGQFGFYTSYSEDIIVGIGETVAVPAGTNTLNSFSIYASSFFSYSGPSSLNAEVIQYSNVSGSPVGTALYSTSSPSANIPGDNSVTLLTFNTGGIQVNPADEYLLEFTQASGDVSFPAENSTYNDGEEVILLNGPSPADGYYPQNGTNLYFQADFSSVPEPASLSLLSLTGLGLLARRRRSKSVSA